MTDNLNKDPIIIFYRTKYNKIGSIANQQDFIKEYLKHLPIATIDYSTDDYRKTVDLFDLIMEESHRLILVRQSSITDEEFKKQFGQYGFFDCFGKTKQMEIYYMDAAGRLYKQVDSIEDLIEDLTTKL